VVAALEEGGEAVGEVEFFAHPAGDGGAGGDGDAVDGAFAFALGVDSASTPIVICTWWRSPGGRQLPSPVR
jgi:hypothetical protein